MGAPKGTRPPGGSRKGRPNKATVARAEALAASGMTPLEFLVHVYRSEGQDINLRLTAAKAAAPYMHASLSSVDMALTGNVQLGGIRPDDLETQP